jgi:CRP/FNR family transcriptional regulator, cyclic AMP receptor protein
VLEAADGFLLGPPFFHPAFEQMPGLRITHHPGEHDCHSAEVWRSPPRLRRCRCCSPLEASEGETSQRLANVDSLFRRSVLSPAATTAIMQRLPRRENLCDVLQAFPISSNFASSGHQLLANSRVLGVLPPEDRVLLSEQCVERRFGKNQVLYVEGAPADSMFVLGSGELKVSNYAADDTELILASVIPGETIGELGMLSSMPSSATVTATRPGSGMMLSRQVVVSLIKRRPAVALAMLQNLADLTRRTSGEAADLVFLHQRVAKFLVNNAQGPSSTVRVTQAHLGSAVGASRQRVNMCLQGFQREGWISISSGTIRVVDPDGLARPAAN